MNLFYMLHARIQNVFPEGSVGRCVIPLEFLGKSVKHIYSCREMYSV